MEIIPAIDIIDGHAVRLTEGDFNLKTVYHEDPVSIARQFEEAGLKRLHLVDLDGARSGKVQNWKVLEDISRSTGLAIDFGGGIKTPGELQRVFDLGAAYAAVGSIAVKDEAGFLDWLEKFGAEKFLLGADVRNGKIAVSGWLETTSIDILDFIEKYVSRGVRQLFCTDVGRDGRLEGPAVDLYRNIIERFPQSHFIASGGVSSLDDLVVLREMGCSGVILGKAIYENRISLEQLRSFQDTGK
jgi:phosphoribosylformimino-5-aminoimidazole carboxamide ribotide isomerase